MICFDCARPHPDYREPEKPIAVTEAACCVCKEVKGCVPNAKMGLPERFPTVAEAFGMIADQVREMQRRKGEAEGEAIMPPRTCKPYEFFNRSTGHTIYGIDAPAGEISWAPLYGGGRRLLYKQPEERDAELNRINKTLLSVETAQAGKVMPEFTVELTDEQAEALRQLADHWRESLDDALHRVVREGFDFAMSSKRNDEHHAETITRQYGPSGDLDDYIPF